MEVCVMYEIEDTITYILESALQNGQMYFSII